MTLFQTKHLVLALKLSHLPRKKKFLQEREEEEKKLDEEVKEEWEKRLQAIQSQQDLKRIKDKKDQKDLLMYTEKENLEKNMTLKRERKREMSVHVGPAVDGAHPLIWSPCTARRCSS